MCVYVQCSCSMKNKLSSRKNSFDSDTNNSVVGSVHPQEDQRPTQLL